MASTMQLTSLSWQQHRPCMLLRWPSTTIMLDCSIDMASFSHFMPFLYMQSERLSRLSPLPLHPALKLIRQNVYIDGAPELHPVTLSSVSMSTVDVIVVSNWTSLLALPFYTEGTGFAGSVYATDPTVQFGRLMMEEMLEYFERIVTPPADSSWKEQSIYNSFNNLPSRCPQEWRSMYSRETMKAALARIQYIAFRETVMVDGCIAVSAYCNGHTIGSCNWLIATEQERIAYVSATSSRTSHTRPVDWEKLRSADTLILTSLSRMIDNSPEQSAQKMMVATVETIKKGGNVILPIAMHGIIYDLIEAIAKHIDAAMEVPIYVISPVAKRALAYANVYAEWLSDMKLANVYIPEEPFIHAALIKSNRVRIFDSIYGDFSRELKTPCVVFTGHPCLRIGDAPHLIEMWGTDPRNTVILTDPDFPPAEVFGPFEDLAIRMLFHPIDTRLDFSQLNPTILPDLIPKLLVVPDCYARAQGGRLNSAIDYNPLTTIRYEETVNIPCKCRKRKITVHPEIAKELKPRGYATNSELGVCSLSGLLSCYDNIYELRPVPEESAKSRKREKSGRHPTEEGEPGQRVRPQCTGKLTADVLVKAFQKAGFSCKQSKAEDGKSTLFNLDKLQAVVRLSFDGLHTNIRAPKENRSRIADVIAGALVQI